MFRIVSVERRAFTLLELMVCLAIMVAIISVAWPRITRRMQLVGPREAALQVKADLAEAREQAIITGEAWVFRIERGGAKYQFGPVSSMRQKYFEPDTTKAGSVEEILGLAAEPEAGDLSNVSLPQGTSSTPLSPIAASPLEVVDKQKLVRDGELPPSMAFDDGFAHSASEVNKLRADPTQANATGLTAAFPTAVPTAIPLPTAFTGAPPAAANPVSTFPQPASIASQPLDLYPDQTWKYAVIFQPDGRSTNSEIRLKEVPTDNKITLRVRAITGGVTIDKLQRKPRNPVQVLDPLSEQNLFDEQLGENAYPGEYGNGPTANSVLPPLQGQFANPQTEMRGNGLNEWGTR